MHKDDLMKFIGPIGSRGFKGGIPRWTSTATPSIAVKFMFVADTQAVHP